MLSPADKWLMNSSDANDPKILKAMGPAMVVIQPDDAAARGIGDLSTTQWYIEGSTEAKRRVVALI